MAALYSIKARAGITGTEDVKLSIEAVAAAKYSRRGGILR